MYHFKGKRGAEHCVRREQPTGAVNYYEGKTGAEHLVRTKRCLSHGDVVTYFKVSAAAPSITCAENIFAPRPIHTQHQACTNHSKN